jgi:hypothetical protein
MGLRKKPRVFRELLYIGSSINPVEFGYNRLAVLIVKKRNRGVLRAHVIDKEKEDVRLVRGCRANSER